jgi:hypothetical protein
MAQNSPLASNNIIIYSVLIHNNELTIKQYTESLIDASKQVGLEVNTEKTEYMLLSRHQNAGQNHDIKIGNRSFDNMAQFKYLRTTATYQKMIQEEIKEEPESG